jgi:hypothetical protein
MISILWKILSLSANIKSMAKEKAKIDNPFVTTGYAGAFDLIAQVWKETLKPKGKKAWEKFLAIISSVRSYIF